MRLLTEGGSLLVYGGRSGWFPVGIGLILLGLAFGVVPLVLYLRGGAPSLLAVGAAGSVLLLVGLWGVTHVQRIEMDRSDGVLRVLDGSRFLASPETIPFDRVREVGVARRVFTSTQPAAVNVYHVLELRLDDEREIAIDDVDVNDDLERVRSRGRRIATFVGAPFAPEVDVPEDEPAG